MKHIFKIDEGGERHWYAADTSDEARELHLNGLEGEEAEIYSIEQCPDDWKLTITEDDGEGTKVTKTCREWADEGNSGLVCSTVY